MSEQSPQDLEHYFQSGENWAADQADGVRHALRLAYIVAGVLGAIALAEAIAIIVMMPLKTVEPYTLLVDRQTGYVEALKPLERELIAPDRALTRSFLAQYVIARESFDIDSLKDDYRKVALWSADEARDRYLRSMQANNPESPLARLPRRALVTTEVRGISSLGPQTALIRFVTIRTDPGGQALPPLPWQAVIAFRFSGSSMSAADRLLNPLGFQVTRYRRDAELPTEISAPAVPSANQTVILPVPAIAPAPAAGTGNPAPVRVP